MRMLVPMLVPVFMTSLVLVALASDLAGAPPTTEELPVGRYQIATGLHGTIFVLDTATGKCWSRTGRGHWVDEGNPTLSRESEAKRPTLELPTEKVLLTIKQRRAKPIPGSKDRILLYLDDITSGQVLVSVRLDDGTVVMDETSMRENDAIPFEIGDQTFYVRLAELTDVVVGDDFAELEVASSREVLEANENGADKEGPDHPIE